MKKSIPIFVALALLGVGGSGCKGEEPVEKAPPVSSNDKNNFQVSTDMGAGVIADDGASSKKGGESASN